MAAVSSLPVLLVLLTASRAGAFKPSGRALSRGSGGLGCCETVALSMLGEQDAWNPFYTAPAPAPSTLPPESLSPQRPGEAEIRRAEDTEEQMLLSLSSAPRLSHRVADELVASALPLKSGGAAAAAATSAAGASFSSVAPFDSGAAATAPPSAAGAGFSNIAPPRRGIAVGGNAGNVPRALELREQVQPGHRLSHHHHATRGGPLGHHRATRGEEPTLLPPPLPTLDDDAGGADATRRRRLRAALGDVFGAD